MPDNGKIELYSPDATGLTPGRKRQLAVEAALGIIRARAQAGTGGGDPFVLMKSLSEIADLIQAALEGTVKPR